MKPKSSPVGWFGAIWGLAGIIAMLAFAVYRLLLVSWEALVLPLDWMHWLLLVCNTLFMAYSEGYRGFQKSFSPKVAARARNLLDNPRLIPVLLAPLYCMHYFDSKRRQLISTYLLTIAIIVLVIVFHQLEQPWRGLLDAGVVVGLSWGIVSIAVCAVNVLRGETETVTA